MLVFASRSLIDLCWRSALKTRYVSGILRLVATYQDRILDAFGDARRREIFERLASHPQAVGELAEQLPVSRPAVSQHLRVLKEAGLVTSQRAGSRHVYQIDPAGIGALRVHLDDLWNRSLASFGAAAAQRLGGNASAQAPPSADHLQAIASEPDVVIAPQLSVRHGIEAVEFYKRALGAVELHRIGGSEGQEDLVCQLAVGDATFWVADESPEHANHSPESLGGGTVRMLLLVADPAAVLGRAVAVGATEVSPVAEEHGWLLGRIADPYGHHWEIGRPLGVWPPAPRAS
jgi:PhnB protein